MSLNVLTAGAGPAMLLLHGFTGSARSWASEIEAWSAHRRIVAPDLLGHAGSDAPTDPARYDLERQADDLAELLRLLDAAPATVVGYSMGARLALWLTLRHPGLVDGLVLESPSAGIVEPRERAARRAADEALAELLEREGLAAFVERWEAQPLFASHAGLAPDVRDAMHRERLRHDPRALAACLRGAGQGSMPPLFERLPEIGCRTLVLAGALDGVGLARARSVAEAIPGASLHVIRGSGHAPHIEDPASFIHIADELVLQRSH